MYSFGNRVDCTVVDEPFYAYYLSTHPDTVHPGREDILSSQSSDFNRVLQEVIFADYASPMVFFKNMAHHLHGAEWRFLQELENIILVRRPDKLISSFIKQIENPVMLDIAIELEYRILRYLDDRDASFIVIDSDQLLRDPEAHLKALCAHLSVPFSQHMLEWPAGPKAADGVWAKFWYSNVHRSSSFGRPDNSHREVPRRLHPLLDEAWEYYNRINEFALKI